MSFYSLKNNYKVSHQVEQFLEQNIAVQDNFEVTNITTHKKGTGLNIYVQIKAQE
jgi:hypothetical protein